MHVPLKVPMTLDSASQLGVLDGVQSQALAPPLEYCSSCDVNPVLQTQSLLYKIQDSREEEMNRILCKL